MKTPTKQEEIDAVRQLAAALGPNSYLGPWLNSIACELDDSLRSDFYPLITLAESHRQATEVAQRIVADAKDQADTIVKNAEREANKIKQNAGQWRAFVLGAIHQAKAAIE